MQRKVESFSHGFYLFTLKCQLEKSICRSMFFYTSAYLSARNFCWKFQCSNYLIRNEWMIEWMNDWMNEWISTFFSTKLSVIVLNIEQEKVDFIRLPRTSSTTYGFKLIHSKGPWVFDISDQKNENNMKMMKLLPVSIPEIKAWFIRSAKISKSNIFSLLSTLAYLVYKDYQHPRWQG